MAPRVLVIEDDPPIAEAVVYALERDGLNVQSVGTLAAARAHVSEVDLLILDLTLPDGNGLTLLRGLVALGSPPRVIVLTAQDEDEDCVLALNAGADDYVSKPFSPRALVARVRAVLRRGQGGLESGEDARVLAGGVQLDIEKRVVSFHGASIPLTKIELDLLIALASTHGKVMTRAQLVEVVWGPGYALTERTVDSHFKGLRRKFEEAGVSAALVETVRGVGFRLREES